VRAVGAGATLTRRIARLEQRFVGASAESAVQLLEAEELGEASLGGALMLKALAEQIDVIVHAVGILTALPYVFREGERVENLSLGAGTGGKRHDLQTNQQIAEFKFIQWRPGERRAPEQRLRGHLRPGQRRYLKAEGAIPGRIGHAAEVLARRASTEQRAQSERGSCEALPRAARKPVQPLANTLPP
jgi:hypothetical protein